MNVEPIIFSGGPIFNGLNLIDAHCAVFTSGGCSAITPNEELKVSGRVVDLQGDILSLGFADLQVNGGGGVLLNDEPSLATLRRIADAHRALGTTRLLPTLITSTPEMTRTAIDAAVEAVNTGMHSIAGLHLEGPHLSVPKKGAHDAQLIRPMQQDDLDFLLVAVKKLPLLKVTIAPENVSLEQARTLSKAGALLALGHTNATYDTCMQYYDAGVHCVTHLFNAMSQFGSRDPGLVGAALDTEGFFTGLIADGVHVHAATIRAALKSMGGMHRVYLVSDAMAVAGTSLDSFVLDGRKIHRRDGQLTLEDGTLAGADLDLTSAIRFLVNEVNVNLVDALRSAVTVPRELLGNAADTGSLLGSALEDCIKIKADLTEAQVATA